MKGKTIFITGGAGFIASHLIDRLIDDNKVIIYDNYLRNSLCFNKGVVGHKNFVSIKGDVLDFDFLCEQSRGVDVIVHCAAIAGIYSVGNQITTTMKVNLIGSYNVFEAAVKNKVKRVIDFSTSEVYGSFIYRGVETNNTTIGPIGEKRWVYAISKLASEHLLSAYANDFGLEAVSVRPFNVYGPRQTGEGAIQQMVLRALKDEDITVYNDGVQIRAWCFVEDFVEALYAILCSDKSVNQVFNIGNPLASITVYGLAQKIIDLTDSKSNIVFKKHPGTEIEVRIPDISKARSLLGFEPQVGLDEGLVRTIKWYTDNLGDL